MKRRNARMALAATPWRAAILAVDPGDTSGWAIYVHGRFVQSGTADPHEPGEMARVIAALDMLASVAELPMVMVRERPWSARMIGPAWGMWDRAWERHGCSKGRIVKVWPSTWMSRVLTVGPRAQQAQLRAASVGVALSVIASAGKLPGELDHDEAAAVCIGRWATHAGEVGKVLGKRAMRAAGMEA